MEIAARDVTVINTLLRDKLEAPTGCALRTAMDGILHGGGRNWRGESACEDWTVC
jgi:hypothetical protein